jgi:chemotaxis signal transduction protein
VTFPSSSEQKLADMRRAFDQAFAMAPTAAIDEFEDLLAVRVGGDALAIRVRAISGLAACRKIVPLPSRIPALLGIAAIRGGVVPIYSLAHLLGYRPGSKPPSWLALCGDPEPMGLGFEEFEGFLRVRRGDVHPAQAADDPKGRAIEVVRSEKHVRPLVDVPSTLERIKARTGAAGLAKER